jgi:TRAP-type C4-dicarboxylate transport system permease small subunit
LGVLDRVYLLASQVLLVGLVLAIGIQVVLRYATSHSILGLEEWTGLMFTWLVFLMAAVLHRRKRHIAVTAIADLFPTKWRNYAGLLISILTVAFCVAVFVQIYNIWPYLSHPTMIYGIPEIVFKLALAVGLGTILLQEVVNIADTVRGLADAPPTGDRR